MRADHWDEILVEPEGEKFFRRLHLRKVLSFLFLCIWLVFGFISIQFVANSDQWKRRSQANQFFEIVHFPPRGIMYDRQGKQIASNQPSIDIFLDFQPLSDNEKIQVQRFIQKNNLLFKLTYERYLVIKNVSQQNILELKGVLQPNRTVEIVRGFRRFYPYAEAMGNVIGYLGFPTEDDLKEKNMFAEEYIGKGGLERTYQNFLRGVPGVVSFERDVKGKVGRTIQKSEIAQGDMIFTTLDAEFQKRAYEMMDAYFKQTGYKKGSLIALNPKDGSVLTMISYPNYDNNAFLENSRRSTDILNNPYAPLFNRAVSGQYAPGSTIKPIVAAGALEEKIISPDKQILSTGQILIPNPYFPSKPSIFKDFHSEGYGWTNMYKGIAESVNTYFYSIGGGYHDQKGLGIYRLKKYYERYGLGSKTGIDIAAEKSGFVPSPETKKKIFGKGWVLGDTYNVSIGQGDLLVTPLQISLFTNAFVSNTLYQPYIIKTIADAKGKVLYDRKPKIIRRDLIDSENLRIIQKAMRMTVTDGSAKTLQGVTVAVAGKSGTPEILGKSKLNAIFTGFAPYEHPQIVMTLFIEEVPLGSVATLPLYRDIMNMYFETHSK